MRAADSELRGSLQHGASAQRDRVCDTAGYAGGGVLPKLAPKHVSRSPATISPCVTRDAVPLFIIVFSLRILYIVIRGMNVHASPAAVKKRDHFPIAPVMCNGKEEFATSSFLIGPP